MFVTNKENPNRAINLSQVTSITRVENWINFYFHGGTNTGWSFSEREACDAVWENLTKGGPIRITNKIPPFNMDFTEEQEQVFLDALIGRRDGEDA